MKLTRLITAGVILPFLLALCVVTTGAAASGGTLVATDALEIKQGEDAHVLIFLNGSYEPAPQALQFKVYYNESVAKCTNITLNRDVFGKLLNPPSKKESGIPFSLVPLASGEIPTGIWLCNITFAVAAREYDGSRMEVGLELEDIGISDTFKYIDVTSIQNGTFTTEDKAKPEIYITTKSPVSSTFNIAGTIYDVGGMGTAQATLASVTRTESFDLDLPGEGPYYSFSQQVTWPVENDVTLTVTATDAAGNTNTTEPFSLDVVNVGFSDPKPADGSHINAIPDCVQACMTEIKAESVTMYLGSANYGPKDLNPVIDNNYVKNTTLLDNLAEAALVNVMEPIARREWFPN